MQERKKKQNFEEREALFFFLANWPREAFKLSRSSLSVTAMAEIEDLFLFGEKPSWIEKEILSSSHVLARIEGVFPFFFKLMKP